MTSIAVGIIWTFVAAVVTSFTMSFATGLPYRPDPLWIVLWGALGGVIMGHGRIILTGALLVVALAGMLNLGIVAADDPTAMFANIFTHVLAALAAVGGTHIITKVAPNGPLNRHEFEEVVLRLLTAFGYVFFTAIVVIPFYVMVMTSFKNQSELVQNPLDFSLDLSKGWDLFRSYVELFMHFDFGIYLLNSLGISVLTVLITLLFSIPGAYAVARLRFTGRAAFSRSILLIYMVPMIVLALPIYIAFSLTGLRNSLLGIVLIYPVTTIPVALYMLQGYFRGLPSEVEEAGLMDGLSRLGVIWKITLPLSLPALASVSLYVFMIAWNEFLLAFMLLDDPQKFTLTRGIASLNSSEIPRQHLMAGAVIATVPIMALFLGLERFMTKGLTAGSVKG
nr:carbohydrate ABC transporter permease [Maritalea mediterranea]